MPALVRDDPYAAYNFLVVIPGITADGLNAIGAFSEVSGLGAEVNVIEYRTGSETGTVRKLPGLAKYPNIVLKRGVIGDLALWNWMLDTLKGSVQRMDGSIVLLDEDRKEVMRWKFRRAWPCKWTGPSLNSKTGEVAMESLELCHEGLMIEGQK